MTKNNNNNGDDDNDDDNNNNSYYYYYYYYYYFNSKICVYLFIFTTLSKSLVDTVNICDVNTSVTLY